MRWRELLIAAKKLISNPAKWCQGTFARKPTGDKCAASNPEACQWCASGAVYRATRDGFFTQEERIEAMRRLADAGAHLEPATISFIDINDKGTHEQVMQLFDVAIGDVNAAT